jgi:hypothetical protein
VDNAVVLANARKNESNITGAVSVGLSGSAFVAAPKFAPSVGTNLLNNITMEFIKFI